MAFHDVRLPARPRFRGDDKVGMTRLWVGGTDEFS